MPFELEMGLRLLLAAVLGAAVDYQRERAGKPAGLRTYSLICLGSALFTVASIYGFGAKADPARIAAGIVTGVGFLGAGAIIRPREGAYRWFGYSSHSMGSSGCRPGGGCRLILVVWGYYCHCAGRATLSSLRAIDARFLFQRAQNNLTLAKRE